MTDHASARPLDTDVIVVGGGNAGFTAAHAAASRGRRVILLERGRDDMAGGNSFYTAGATRFVHNGLADLQNFIEHDERHDRTEVPPYTAEEFRADMERVTEGRTDPELCEILVNETRPTLEWLNSLGLKYRLMYEGQAYEREDGSFLFWGGLHVGNVGGGEGLIADHTRVAKDLGTDIRYGHRARRLLVEDGRVVGVVAEIEGADGASEGEVELRAESVILAAGGFEASPELRAQYLGERWANAKVRGTPYNVGDMIQAGLDAGAAKGGDFESCHSIQWDAELAQNESNRELTNRLSRQSYPLGILVNKDGKRFLDEGADYRNYTYAKYGKVILEQPDSFAYQIFDADLRPMVRTEDYEMPGVSVYEADTLEGLADQLQVEKDTFLATVRQFNESIDDTKQYNPNTLDGRSSDVQPPKSNWAVAIDRGPFYAYPVTCGITFTFGGLKTDSHGRVLDENGEHIPGLFAAGEMLGGLFSINYPGGSGLAAGMTFGKRAGEVA